MQRIARKFGKTALYYMGHPLEAFNGDRIITAAHGFRLAYRHENFIERTIAAAGIWEPAETAAVLRYVKPGHVCIDVGANVGYFSLLMANLGAHVIAYEPTTYGFTRLLHNIDLNPGLRQRIAPVKLALGAAPATITAAIEARFSLRVLAHTEPETISVDALDRIWKRERLDFLKVDVDGYDTGVIRGALSTLRLHKPVVMAEFSQRQLLQCGSSVDELGSAFLCAGYTTCEIPGGGQMALTEFLRSSAAQTSQNVLLHHGVTQPRP